MGDGLGDSVGEYGYQVLWFRVYEDFLITCYVLGSRMPCCLNWTPGFIDGSRNDTCASSMQGSPLHAKDSSKQTRLQAGQHLTCCPTRYIDLCPEWYFFAWFPCFLVGPGSNLHLRVCARFCFGTVVTEVTLMLGTRWSTPDWNNSCKQLGFWAFNFSVLASR